jgi:hypothetical protein
VNGDGPITREWKALSQHIDALCSRYSEELGENAYAAFNTITEFASQPPKNRCLRRERHSLQRLAGDWMSKFTKQCRQPGFTVSEYLKKLLEDSGDDGRAINGSGTVRAWQY